MRFDWLISTGLGVTSALVLTLPAAAAQLQSWQFNERENQLVFTTDTAVQPRAQMVFNPTRVVIDLPGTTLGRPSSRQAVGGAIREVRSGQFDAQTARLVIELAAGYTLDPRAVEVRGVNTNQWVVQLPQPERSAAPTAQAGNSGNSGNSITGDFSNAATSFLSNIVTTPDGFLFALTARYRRLTYSASVALGAIARLSLIFTTAQFHPFSKLATSLAIATVSAAGILLKIIKA